MKNEIKISVIVPIYNVETYVKDCLESIINQPFKDIEIICIDDCSTDNSMVVVESFAKKDSRIKILKHKENRGQSAARNTGMEIASGKYIAFIDSDDTIERDYFINLYEAAEKSGADVTECGYKMVSKNKPVSCHSFHNGIYYNFDNILPRIKKCFVWIRLWRSDFLKKNSLQFYNGIYFEDILFVIQAAYYAKSWNIRSKNSNFIFYKKCLAFFCKPFYIDIAVRDVAQPGSAFAWGASGRWFESSHPDQPCDGSAKN